MSIECDVLFEEGELSERVDAALGKTSAYQAEHGVYVDTVPATFPFLPPGWESRVRTIEVPGLRARCLELHIFRSPSWRRGASRTARRWRR